MFLRAHISLILGAGKMQDTEYIVQFRYLPPVWTRFYCQKLRSELWQSLRPDFAWSCLRRRWPGEEEEGGRREAGRRREGGSTASLPPVLGHPAPVPRTPLLPLRTHPPTSPRHSETYQTLTIPAIHIYLICKQPVFGSCSYNISQASK